MKYIWEALSNFFDTLIAASYIWGYAGNGQRLGVWRNTSLNVGDTRTVEQDSQSDEDTESDSDEYWESDEDEESDKDGKTDEDGKSEADEHPQDEDTKPDEDGEPDEDKVLEEEGEPDVITIEPGDRIFADFSSTHTNDVRPLVPDLNVCRANELG